jgi:hypothetical protein
VYAQGSHRRVLQVTDESLEITENVEDVAPAATSGRARESKDMQRMLPTTDPLSRNSLDETYLWILADEKKRQGAADAHPPRDALRSELEHSASRSGDLPSASIAR